MFSTQNHTPNKYENIVDRYFEKTLNWEKHKDSTNSDSPRNDQIDDDITKNHYPSKHRSSF